MKRIVFHIDDEAWFRAELAKQTTPEGVEAIMEGLPPAFRAVYTLSGEDDRPKQYPDHYELTTPDGVKIPLNSLNGYQRGCVLLDCERYYVGETHFEGGESPLGVVKIEDKSD